jgi:hypothetical protein
MKKLELFGSGLEGLAAQVTAQQRVNCFYEVHQDGDKEKITVRGTPGLTIWTTVPDGLPIRGLLVANNVLYVAAGEVLYAISAGGSITVIGNITPGLGIVGMNTNGVQLIVVDGATGWTYTYATTTFAQITAAAFPSGATTVAYLDGYFICEFPNSQQFALSAINDGTTWPALQFASAVSNPDLLLACDVWQGTLILWGASSIEFWQDANTFPFPLQRLSGSTSMWGLAAKHSRAPVGDSMMFLGANSQGLLQVMTLNGTIPQRVSTHDIENLISSLSLISDAVALTYIVDGHIMYQLTFPTANVTFLYDTITMMWSTCRSGIAPSRHQGLLSITFNNVNYVTDYDTGNIYQLNKNVYTEEGQPILREIDTRHIWSDGDVITVAELWLDMSTGTGLQSGQGSNPQIMMQVSKDGGRTFGSPRQASIGRVGQYGGPRAVWHRLGSARDFVFKFTMTDPVPFNIIGGSAVITKAPQA